MWIARDKNGELNIFGNKPFKRETMWDNCGEDYSIIDCDVDLCPEVKWEDDEPTKLILSKKQTNKNIHK